MMAIRILHRTSTEDHWVTLTTHTNWMPGHRDSTRRPIIHITSATTVIQVPHIRITTQELLQTDMPRRTRGIHIRHTGPILRTRIGKEVSRTGSPSRRGMAFISNIEMTHDWKLKGFQFLREYK